MSERIQQNNNVPEWIIMNIQQVNQFTIWIIEMAREEGTLTALNYEA